MADYSIESFSRLKIDGGQELDLIAEFICTMYAVDFRQILVSALVKSYQKKDSTDFLSGRIFLSNMLALHVKGLFINIFSMANF